MRERVTHENHPNTQNLQQQSFTTLFTIYLFLMFKELYFHKFFKIDFKYNRKHLGRYVTQFFVCYDYYKLPVLSDTITCYLQRIIK